MRIIFILLLFCSPVLGQIEQIPVGAPITLIFSHTYQDTSGNTLDPGNVVFDLTIRSFRDESLIDSVSGLMPTLTVNDTIEIGNIELGLSEDIYYAILYARLLSNGNTSMGSKSNIFEIADLSVPSQVFNFRIWSIVK